MRVSGGNQIREVLFGGGSMHQRSAMVREVNPIYDNIYDNYQELTTINLVNIDNIDKVHEVNVQKKICINNLVWVRTVLDSDLPSPTKLVGICIGMVYNPTQECFVSLKYLQSKSGLGRTRVSKAIKQLVEGGWMESSRRYNRTNIYVLYLPEKKK